MARRVFVKDIDGGNLLLMSLEIKGRGTIRGGTITKGRQLSPIGRGRLVNPKEWIHLQILSSDPKAIGNARVYRAIRIKPPRPPITS